MTAYHGRILLAVLIILVFIELAIVPLLSVSESDCSIGQPNYDSATVLSSLEDTTVAATSFSLQIGGLLTVIECPVRISLMTFAGSPELLFVGFDFLPLTIVANPIVDAPVGLAIERIFSYPYSYINGTRQSDWWVTGIPQYEMYRPYKFWTPTGGEGSSVGEAWLDDLPSPVTIGEYLWLDGIHVCLSSGQNSSCTPSRLLLWTEFRWNLTAWSVQTTIWDSLYKAEVLGDTAVSLEASIPVGFLGYGLIASSLVIAFCVSIYYLWKRKTKGQSKEAADHKSIWRKQRTNRRGKNNGIDPI
jgi:hypothetical protein